MPQMYTNGLKKPFDDGLTKTMFDQPEALEAWTYLIGKVFKRKTSPTVLEAKQLAGEFGNPFAAGKIGIWPTDQVGSTGLEASRIKDRFTWALLPEVVAPGGGSPGHSWSIRSNLVTGVGEHDGNVHHAVDLAVFLAGERFQGRIGIERGHLPVNRTGSRSTRIGSAAAGGDEVAEGVCGPAGQPEPVPVPRAGKRGGGITRGWRGRGGLARSRPRSRWRRVRHGASGSSRSMTGRSRMCVSPCIRRWD